MKKIAIFSAISFFIPSITAASVASITIIEELKGRDDRPTAVSNRGDVVAGYNTWSPDFGVRNFGRPVTDISSDGSIVLGRSGSIFIENQRYPLPYEQRSLHLAAMSEDASVVGGTYVSYGSDFDKEEHLTQQLWVEGEGFIAEGRYAIKDVSPNGKYAVGAFNSSMAIHVDTTEGQSETWTAEALPDCYSQCGEIELNGVSSTGIVVGAIGSKNPYTYIEQPAYWENGIPTRLGGISEDSALGRLIAVSENGKVAVGQAKTNDDPATRYNHGSEAIIWDKANGVRSLEDLLVDHYGLELNGWILYSATAISNDGYNIAGIAINEAGEYAPWVVRLIDECTVSAW